MLKFVEDLLQGAPVEWKKLGEVCDFRHGFSFKASLFKKVGDPVIRIMNIHDDRVTLENLAYFDRADYTTDLAPWRVQKGDILIAMSGATTGKIGFVDNDIPAYINQRVGKFIPDSARLNNRYLFYFLANKVQTIYEMAYGGAQPNLSSSDLLDNLLIPLPPLPVQEKIVEILDKFTELEAELKTELELRKKQYEYYRNKLLTFGDEVEWKRLGEVCDLRHGFSFKASQFKKGGEPVIRITNIHDGRISREHLAFFDKGDYTTDIAPWQVQKGDILIALSGATTGKIGFVDSDFIAYINQRVGKFLPNLTQLNNRYLFHFLLTQTQTMYDMAHGGAQPNLSSSDLLNNIIIPLPPLSEQARIVSILDKFDTLANSLTEGLPREIALRHKQYEYYRDALLTFPKAT